MISLVKKQDPNSVYAAVFPKWASVILKNEDEFINSNGGKSRDLYFMENAVQVNLLSAVAKYDAKH